MESPTLNNPHILVKHHIFWYNLGFPNPFIGNLVRHLLIILSLFLFILTNISCTSTSSTTSDNATTSDNVTTLVFDNETTSDNITISSGLFVAVGHQEYSFGKRDLCCKYISKLLKSSDNGTTWSTLSFSEGSLHGISYVNETFLVGLDSAILTSSDGISWSVIYYSHGPYFTKFFYGNGTYLAPFCNGMTILSSNDGTTWKTIPLSLIHI